MRLKKACSCRDFFEKGCAGQPSDLALNDFSDGKTGGWQRFVGEKPAVLETIAENAAIFFIKEVPSVALPEGYKKQMWKVRHSKKVPSYAATQILTERILKKAIRPQKKTARRS